MQLKNLFVFAILLPLTLAASNLQSALTQFCNELYDIVGTLAMTMIVMSSIVYSGGQFLSAETRARATVWSSNLLTGAIIGIIITILLPTFLGAILGVTINTQNCSVS